ncbi:MAG: Phosphoserine phosphatase [Actinomycetota bacterium]|jgi:HAD superfamily hydrolase (TIGR01490 family)
MSNTITVISKPGCHLCETLVPELEDIAKKNSATLEKVNLLEHPELQAKYAELIPVVLVDGIEVGHLVVAREQVESALVPITGAKSAAFFDLDNTVIRGSSLWHLGRGLVKHKFITAETVRQFFWKQFKFVTIGKEHIGDMDFIRRQSLKIIAGREVRELETKGALIAREMLVPKVFRQSLELAKAHLEKGDDVWIVTASPRRLAMLLSRELGFTGAIGSEAEIVGGKYTGEMIGNVMHGAEKAVAIRQLSERRGYDLTQCTAYSDSANDLPLLQAVGTAVVINGDRKLRAHARKAGWAIKDFRRSRHARKYGISTLSLGLVPIFNKLFRRNR